MPVKKMIAKVEFKDNLADDTWLVRFKFQEEVHFIPGQYVSIRVNDEGERRSYSVASVPSDGEKIDYIDILISVAPMGIGSRFFLGLKVGDPVEVLGFMGRFLLEKNEGLKEVETLLMVATGSGIAPVKPMIKDLLTRRSFSGKVVLVWGMRRERDLYWLEEFERLERDHENFKFELVLSQPEESWPGNRGHVGDVIDKLTLDWERVLVYLCGVPDMVEEMTAKLMAKGVVEENIRHEKYA